jgi:GH24 family phage-related lysozyme (muramidase)
MSLDEPGGDAPSLAQMLALLRRRAGGDANGDPLSQALADIARRARLPRGGGLFGGDYARFMADRAPSPPQLLSRPPGTAGGFGAVFGPQAAGLDGRGPEIDPSETYQVAGPVAAREGAAPAQAARPNQQSGTGALAASPQGQAFIQRWELNAKTGQPYFDITPDDKNNPTFGYGHKVEAGEQAALQAKVKGLNRADRAALIDQTFRNDLALAEQRVKDRLGPEAMKTLNQGQFDALVADAFNAGTAGALGPQMLQNIWDGDVAAAGKQFNSVWATDAKTGKRDVLRGLVRRSLQQAAIFNRGDYNYAPTDQEIEAARQAALARAAAKAP